MYKGYAVIFMVFLLMVFLLRITYRNNPQKVKKIAYILLTATIVINIGYNIKNVFPTFLYDGVPIGDSKENLLVYKKDSEFKWQILNSISHNRSVKLDQEGEEFHYYFTIFANKVSVFNIPDENRACILDKYDDFEVVGNMSMVKQLPYAFPQWEGQREPVLYLNVEGLKDCGVLIGMTVEKENGLDLYVMSEEYYKNALDQEAIQ